MKIYPKYRDAKSGVYVIRNVVNGKFYVGSTSCDKRRWYTHKNQLTRGVHDNLHLQRSWNKHGKRNFEFELIVETSPEKALLLEEFWLESWVGVAQCYNISKSAVMSGLGRVWTDEQRVAISEGQRKRKLTVEEKENLIQYGRIRPPLSSFERRAIHVNCMANARLKVASLSSKEYRKHLEKRGKAISKATMGHSVSEETRQKISKSLKGKPWTKARRLAQTKTK